MADLNGDGKPDLVALSGTGLVVLLGNGDGTFKRLPVVTVSGSQAVPADFNHDGKTDLALYAGNGINILLGNGDGTFAPPLLVPKPNNLCVAVGDFNGDGNQDVAGCGFSNVEVFPGTGKGTFGNGIISQTPSAPVYLAVADLDGDGKTDLVGQAIYINGYNPALGPVYVLFGKGDGTFEPALQIHSEVGPLFSLAIGDLDGDGKPDIATAGIYGIMAVLHNAGARNFTLQAAYPIAYSQGYLDAVIVADLKGTHFPDIIASNSAGAFFSILSNDGSGRFRDIRSLELTSEYSPEHGAYGELLPMAKGGFRRIGGNDIVVALGQADSPYEYLEAFLASGDAKNPLQAGPKTPLDAGSVIASMVAGDFDGDGKQDLAVCFSSPSSFIRIYFGNGDGSFRPGPAFAAPGRLWATDMIAADFNGDGKLDLGLSTGYVALGKGAGIFSKPIQFFDAVARGDPGLWLEAADFNHDGKLDLAFMLGYDIPEQLMIFSGNGDGTFQKPVTYSVEVHQWAQIADVNGDGNPDIVVLNLGAGDPTHTIEVFLGNANGTFQPPSFVSGYRMIHPSMLVARDLNGDGKVDLAVMDGYGSNVFLYAGRGDGTFERQQEFGAGNNPAWLTAGNFQGQQKQGFEDLLMVGGPNSFVPLGTRALSLSVLLNQGFLP